MNRLVLIVILATGALGNDEVVTSDSTSPESERSQINRTSRSAEECFKYGTLTKKHNDGTCYNSRSPHIVAIMMDDYLHCSGILISDRFVLTSVYHCLKHEPSQLKIRIGLGVDQDIKQIFRHPESGDLFTGVDLGLIELAAPVKLNHALVPACLAQNNTEHLNENLIRSGFSGLQIFQHFETTENRLMSFEECSAFMRKAFFLKVEQHQLCVELLEDFEGFDFWAPVQGLPGSSLQLTDSNGTCTTTIVGVGSRNHFGSTNLIVYTRIAPFFNWIESIVWGQDS
ncbi:vitamin K-dependent protein C-like [Uranotaenia lowii]|uniref:vitamin K-dependent protein C-like n=1 Tax=Uranotaenia lowii TaxID=190385 RepID=UPI0024797C27|nr:vitamin K-dependent protein C-like [Uranotaenia lowii]